MDIIPVIKQLMTEIFLTTEKFLDHPEEFSQMEESLIRIHERSCREIMVKILEEADQVISGSPRRKTEYTIQRHDDRTLITACGDITFNRTPYRNRTDGSYHYLLDEKIRLPKDEHFSELAEVKALQVATDSSYQTAADALSIGMQKVSKVSIMNKVHGIIPDLPAESPMERKKCKYLYSNAGVVVREREWSQGTVRWTRSVRAALDGMTRNTLWAKERDRVPFPATPAGAGPGRAREMKPVRPRCDG